MIRLTYLLRRKPGLSLPEFQRYWRETHGPLVARHATALNLARYIQVHTIDDPVNSRLPGARGRMEDPYDGVAELWWTSRRDLEAALGTPEARSAGAELLEDEARFIDLPRSPLWLGHEYPQVNPSPENLVARESSPLVKFYFPLRQRPELSLEEAQLYWRTEHGPLIRSNAQAGRILRYVQVHRCEHEQERLLRAARGTAVDAYCGHAELWFDRGALGEGTPEAIRARDLAVEDESRFIDFSRSTMWLGKERVFVDRL